MSGHPNMRLNRGRLKLQSPRPLFWKPPHSTNCLEFITTGKQADSRISNFIQQKFCGKTIWSCGVHSKPPSLFLNQIIQSSDCSVLQVSHFAPPINYSPLRPGRGLYGSTARLTPSHSGAHI